MELVLALPLKWPSQQPPPVCFVQTSANDPRPWFKWIFLKWMYVVAPSLVTRPQYTVVGQLSYTITWKQPCRANGVLRSFDISVTGTRNGRATDKCKCSVLANATVNSFSSFKRKFSKICSKFLQNTLEIFNKFSSIVVSLSFQIYLTFL